MSGHSKWSTIKRKKGALDAKRGQMFGKLAKQITVAARLGKNLDMAVGAARAANMPKDNIDRAIAKGMGTLDGVQLEEALYEAYGPGGAALLIEVVTDNTNRTLGELRAVFNKQGGNLAQPGAVQYLFDQRGVIEVALGDDPDATQLSLIELGIDDVQLEDDRVVGYASPSQLHGIQQAAVAAGLSVLATRISWIPKSTLPIAHDAQEKLLRLMELLDDLDDVQSVETNAELGEA